MVTHMTDNKQNYTSLMDLPLWGDDETHARFLELCEEKNISPEVFGCLIKTIRKHQTKIRARGIYDDIDECLGINEIVEVNKD